MVPRNPLGIYQGHGARRDRNRDGGVQDVARRVGGVHMQAFVDRGLRSCYGDNEKKFYKKDAFHRVSGHNGERCFAESSNGNRFQRSTPNFRRHRTFDRLRCFVQRKSQATVGSRLKAK
jgi:hypothetical protein